MKISVVYITLVLLSVVSADHNDDAPINIERVSKQSGEVSKSPSTETPYKAEIEIIKLRTAAPSKKSEPMPNLLPIEADCFGSFPGTPAWNDCMRKFQEDIAENRRRIQDMNAAAAKMPQTSYSGRSSSNSVLGGYAIRTENIPQSNMITNGVIKVMLFVNGYDDLLSIEREGRVITVRGIHDGQDKFAEIRVPEAANLDKVEVKRTGQTIVISGPVANVNVGSVQMSQTGGGFTWSSSNRASVPDVFAPVPVQPFNPFAPMPDFGRKVHGFLDGFHKSFLGFGTYKAPELEQPMPKPRNNKGILWFF